MSITKKILLAVLVASVIGVVVMNLNLVAVNDFLKNPSNNSIQTSVMDANSTDSSAQNPSGKVDVEDIQNSSVTRAAVR